MGRGNNFFFNVQSHVLAFLFDSLYICLSVQLLPSRTCLILSFIGINSALPFNSMVYGCWPVNIIFLFLFFYIKRKVTNGLIPIRHCFCIACTITQKMSVLIQEWKFLVNLIYSATLGKHSTKYVLKAIMYELNWCGTVSFMLVSLTK